MKRFPNLAGIFVMVAVLVIYNTVKLSVFARKDLIKSLELIGATRTFIKMPFIFEGIIDGLLSALVAFPCLLATVNGSNYLIKNFTSKHTTNYVLRNYSLLRQEKYYHSYVFLVFF